MPIKVVSGTVTVTTAGTRVAFPSARGKCLWIKIRAKEGNTGIVYIGDVEVSASDGYPLHEGTDGVHSEVEINCDRRGGGVDLNSIYVDAATNGDDVDFIALVEQ